MGALTDALLKAMGAGGAYVPLTNTLLYASDMPKDGYYNGSAQNVITHENEHKNTLNLPGDYSSEKAKRIADKLIGPDLYKMGYLRAEFPQELMAFSAGANASEIDPTRQAQWPHPGWGDMPKDAKLWYLQNKMGHLTDQGYLEDVRAYGEAVANAKQRYGHMAKRGGSSASEIGNWLMKLIQKEKSDGRK